MTKEELRKIMHENKLSIEEVADITEMSRFTVYKWLDGSRDMNTRFDKKLIDHLKSK